MLLLLLMAELAGALWAVRTALFLDEPISNALARLGARLGGRFHYERVGPWGATGVEIEGLSFTPTGSARAVLVLDHTRLFPSVPALLSGRIEVDRIEVDRATARLDARLLATLRAQLSGAGGAATAAPVRSRLAALVPRGVWIGRLDLHIQHPGLTPRGVDVRFRALRAGLGLGNGPDEFALAALVQAGERRIGRIDAEWRAGEAPHLRLVADPTWDWRPWLAVPGLPAATALHARRIELGGAGAVHIQGAAADGLSEAVPMLGGWQLEAARADALDLRWTADGAGVQLQGGTLTMSLGDARTDIPVARADVWSDWALRFPDLFLVLGASDGGQAEVRLHPEQGDTPLVVSVDARGYDVSPWGPLFPADLPLRLRAGRFSGTLSLAVSEGGQGVLASVDGALEDGSADAPFLSVRPLEQMAVGLHGEVDVDLSAHRLTWEHGCVTLGGVPVDFDTRLDWSDASPGLSLTADLHDVDAEQLRQGLPRGLAPTLEGASLAGTLSADVRVSLDGAHPEDSQLDVDLDLSRLSVRSLGTPFPIERLAGDFAVQVTSDDDERLMVGPRAPGWVPFDQVSPYLRDALVSAEDGHFWNHEGFDWTAIQASVQANLREGRVVRGGSTISQQVVRTLFLGHERTLGRKFEEAFLTWQLEQRISKRRILEIYVNAVHWGPGIHGVREAARTYFHRTPAQLTVTEAAFLAAILPNPDYFGMEYARNILPPSRREKICNILVNMRNMGSISDHRYRQDCSAVNDGIVSIVPVPAWLVDFPPSPPPGEPTATASLE